MQSRLQEIEALDAKVLAISTDAVDDNRRLADSAGIQFSLLSDADGAIMDAFGLRHAGGNIDGGDIARPAVFIVDRDGKIVWRDLTDNWRVRVRGETILQELKNLP